MRNPQTIEIGARRTPAETVKHVIYPVAEDCVKKRPPARSCSNG